MRKLLDTARPIAFALLTACAHQIRAEPPTPVPPQNLKPKSTFNLSINGFNYTDLPIDSFSVASRWGGNIVVSSPTSGGGGSTCCFAWHSKTKTPIPISIKWMRYSDGKQRWCNKIVMLTESMPTNATALDVHFMPDGNIEVEFSDGALYPKLKLQRFSPSLRKETGNTIYDEEVAECSDAE